MKVAPEPLSEVVRDVAAVATTERFTEGQLELAWRMSQGFSRGLMQLARERCARLHDKGLLELVPGPRGGRGWKFTALARERYSDSFKKAKA
ncbi:hypothetical protein [Comamonas testosteroni]|jgi:hypothetical protein|uniref:hypothetical protein n=1 Tax=Comamonas testosteroni TaxID=285 RepID=UPI0026ED2D0E|nr:hypothetical protein [Comamonas testosteroni]